MCVCVCSIGGVGTKKFPGHLRILVLQAACKSISGSVPGGGVLGKKEEGFPGGGGVRAHHL